MFGYIAYTRQYIVHNIWYVVYGLKSMDEHKDPIKTKFLESLLRGALEPKCRILMFVRLWGPLVLTMGCASNGLPTATTTDPTYNEPNMG